MKIEVSRIIMLAVATVSTLLWLYFAMKNADKYADFTDVADPEEYKYPELFCIGFSLMELFRFNKNSRRARKRINEISQIKGRIYAEYHFLMLTAAKWSYGFTLFTLFSLLAVLAGEPLALAAGVLFAGLLMWYTDEKFNDKLEEKRDLLIADFPQMLTKMTLLVNSGMVVRDAWKKIAEDGGDRPLFQEMRLAVQEMQNGVTEIGAYDNFANRCGLKEMRRFTATVSQAMQKGNAEMAFFIRDLSDDMWQEKKNMVKRKGEAAASKLIIPTALIFVGILVMIIVPAFSGM